MRRRDLITSREAVKLFVEADLSEATFRRRIRQGVIKPELEEGRERGAMYPRDQVLAAISRSTGKKVPRQKAQESSGATDWVQASDLPYLLALDYEMYGIEETVDLSITHDWWKKNPYMCRVLYNAEERKDVWGYLTIVPMEEATIFKLLRREMHERDMRPEHILTYGDNRAYTVYANSIVIKPEHRAYMRDLINSVLTYWCNQYPRVRIAKLYAYAESEEGWNLIKHLFFSPRYDIGERAFELDPHQVNPSKLIKAFQDCLKEREKPISIASPDV